MTSAATPKNEAPEAGEGIERPCAETDADRKIIATLTARAALVGHQLVQLADGSFMVSRWGLVRPLIDVAAVEDFLRQVGAS